MTDNKEKNNKNSKNKISQKKPQNTGKKKKLIITISIAAVLIAALALTLVLVLNKEDDDSGATLLSFAQANSVEEMQSLDGQKVSIIGYMSTLSPVSGEFMYLMNLPYQSCPFCVPNTTELSNTLAVYSKNGKEFEFTSEAIQVTGIMEFGDYTDEFGYEYGYRIKDASYSVLNTENMSEELKIWQQLAASGVVGDTYSMFEYLHFLCYWPTYTEKLSDGTKDYVSPESAIELIENKGAAYNYGIKEGYFDDLVSNIKEVDETRFDDLVEIIEQAKTLSEKAYADLKNGNYRYTEEYAGKFADGRYQYELYNWSELEGGYKELYRSFSSWMDSFKL